ncbi:Iodotyrosine deiodinase 1 [Holothuria leucospilota]|uniref:Iodotyrosine deiodinase 1 n=1 Tax=Holothuria leucospilota TaxID=206669 RepID=A0A9Q1HHB9_HOLLE|nr:Iodotyrosine deiodinase 1 [Holothuria leucospilota]
MAVVTNVLLYCFPYILSLVLGVFLSGIWSKWQSSQLHAPTVKKQSVSKEDNRRNAKEESKETNDESNQEDCGGEHDDEDTGFNLQEGTHIPFRMKYNFTEEEMVERSEQFYKEMNDRRSVRFYSDRPVPLRVIENIIKTAGLQVVFLFFGHLVEKHGKVK